MTTTKRKMSLTKRNLIIDVLVAGVFLVALSPRLTGLALHEWISVGLGAMLITHMVLHWRWILATTTRLFGRTATQARWNYALNLVLLALFVLVIGSGLMVSETVLPFLGIGGGHNRTWEALHRLSAEWIVWVAALHIALHWKWIVNAVKRYVVEPLRVRRRPVLAQPEMAAAEVK